MQNTNFWGPVYTTHFAIPHLKKTKGKIVAVASPAGWSGVPRMSIYAVASSSSLLFLFFFFFLVHCIFLFIKYDTMLHLIQASKAAMIIFYETLRIELGLEIGVTIVFPGLIENGNTNPDLLAEVWCYHHISFVFLRSFMTLSHSRNKTGRKLLLSSQQRNVPRRLSMESAGGRLFWQSRRGSKFSSGLVSSALSC